MKTIEVSGAYGELELVLTPGELVRVRSPGLFAITDLRLRAWQREDADASLVISRARQARDKRPDASIVLGQLGKRGLFPLRLFYEDPLLTFCTLHARNPIELTVHHEAILP